MKTTEFIKTLTAKVYEAQAQARVWQDFPLEKLNHKPEPQRWSMLECIEHLNRYARFYVPQFEKALRKKENTTTVAQGWLGKKIIDMVQSEKPQSTLKHLNPANSALNVSTIDEFLTHQDRLLVLLEQAASSKLNANAVPIEFFRLLKLKTGAMLEFVILHQQRHLRQAIRAAQQ